MLGDIIYKRGEDGTVKAIIKDVDDEGKIISREITSKDERYFFAYVVSEYKKIKEKAKKLGIAFTGNTSVLISEKIHVIQ